MAVAWAHLRETAIVTGSPLDRVLSDHEEPLRVSDSQLTAVLRWIDSVDVLGAEPERDCITLSQVATALGLSRQSPENAALYDILTFWDENGAPGVCWRYAIKRHLLRLWQAGIDASCNDTAAVAPVTAAPLGSDRPQLVGEYHQNGVSCVDVDASALLGGRNTRESGFIAQKLVRFGGRLGVGAETDSKEEHEHTMLLFHGTTIEAATSIATEMVLDGVCSSHCDFGTGFYTTTCWQYAAACAYAKFIGNSGSEAPAIVCWKMTKSKLDTVQHLDLSTDTEAWSQAVRRCRSQSMTTLLRENRVLCHRLRGAGCVSGPIVGNAVDTDSGKPPVPYKLEDGPAVQQYAFKGRGVELLNTVGVHQVARLIICRGQWGPLQE